MATQFEELELEAAKLEGGALLFMTVLSEVLNDHNRVSPRLQPMLRPGMNVEATIVTREEASHADRTTC